MALFPGPDSPAYRAWSAAADVVILNVLTLAGCLPVVTAGASLTALSDWSSASPMAVPSLSSKVLMALVSAPRSVDGGMIMEGEPFREIRATL